MTFSRRFAADAVRPITIRNEAPQALRDFVFTLMFRYCSSWDAQTIVRTSLKRLTHENPFFTSASDELKQLVDRCQWFRVYDLIEAMAVCIEQERPYAHLEFVDLLNAFFEENGIGWKLVDNQLEARGDEAFEVLVTKATESLQSAGHVDARRELHEAIRDLSRRPEPDLTGAVSHAMNALECVANDACSESGLELGKVIKKYPDRFRPPLGDAIKMLYGFASNNGRHVRGNGQVPELKEAELIVGIAASVATYLSH